MPRKLRAFFAGWAILLCAAIAAAPANAATPGNYTYTVQGGATFPLLTTGLIIPFAGQTDDTTVLMTTSSTRPFRLPFALHVYGHNYSSVRVSSNGNLQFGGANSAAFTNNALPDSQFSTGGANATLFPFWDDLYFVPSDTGHFFNEGIFTKTSGVAPNRTFVISWQGHAFNSESYFVLVQAVFKESSQTIRYRYGSRDNQTSGAPSETIGAQFISPTIASDFLQIAFNPAPPGAVAPGTQFILTHH
ncbi:MAG TPA: hypothetical protein VGC71_12230 [Gaiellales bacterium]|jgi:hypothetical protein